MIRYLVLCSCAVVLNACSDGSLPATVDDSSANASDGELAAKEAADAMAAAEAGANAAADAASSKAAVNQTLGQDVDTPEELGAFAKVGGSWSKLKLVNVSHLWGVELYEKTPPVASDQPVIRMNTTIVLNQVSMDPTSISWYGDIKVQEPPRFPAGGAFKIFSSNEPISASVKMKSAGVYEVSVSGIAPGLYFLSLSNKAVLLNVE